MKKSKYFTAGELTFPKCVLRARVQRFYRTRFGYGVPHSGVIYAKNDANTALALRRLTGNRLPHLPGEEARLQANNRHFFTSRMGPICAKLRTSYAPHFEGYLGMEEEARLHHADPHPKRELRIQAYQELLETGFIHKRLWMRVKDGMPWAEGKMKPEEYAKPGKKPRMIVDLGVAASLQGFRLTEFLKQAQSSEPFHYRGGIIEFIKDPNPETLTRVFGELINPSGRFYFCYFSDDACYSVRTPNGVFRANIDISSCDASHTEAVFDRLVGLMPHQCEDDMRRLVEQCSVALKIRSVENKKLSVYIKPDRPRLYSGATITTAINNLANIAIAVAITDAEAQSGPTIVAAADEAGYIVTVDECTVPERIQFLKHSPILDERGVYRPLINLGVIVRLSGACKRDLPGKGPLAPRARAFQSALLQGLCAGAEFPWLTAMKRKVSGPVPTAVRARVEEDLGLRQGRIIASATARFEDSAVLRRYTDNLYALEELYQLADTGFEEQVGNALIAKILSMDYGLTVNFGLLPVQDTALLEHSATSDYRPY